jgi:hypothetical protein
MMKKMALMMNGMFASIFLLLTFQPCLGGVVIEQLRKDMDGKASEVTLYFSDSRFRTDHEEGGLTTIMDFKGDRMVMVDHRSKSYVDIKFSQWEKEVAERLKKETSAIQARARKITVKRTGEAATINGFRTEKIQILADGELIEENWVTRDVDMKEVEKVMERVAIGFSKEFRVEMKEGKEIYEKLKPYGYPILIKDYSMTHGLAGVNVQEVRKIEKKELKDDLFLPPVGYQQVVPRPSKP